MAVTGYWRDQAACLDADPASFYATNAMYQRLAIDIWCADCPVRSECLADALASPQHQDHGVRGGTTRRERQALRLLPTNPDGA